MATVLVAGGSGMIGSRLSVMLTERGYKVLHLSRTVSGKEPFPTYHWDVEAGTIDQEAVKQADYVINLAGAGIADQRWTPSRKELIIESRTAGNRLLKRTMHELGQLPKAFLSAGAVGYYGNRGESMLMETDEPGEGFLSESVIKWEQSVQETAMELGLRTVILRAGMVLSTKGGALQRMLQPTTFLLSGYFGDGQQWWSWIHIDDLCRLYIQAIEDESMSGIYNAVTPNPVRSKEFAKTLADALDKPVMPVSVPAFALRLAFGEMADTILDSTLCSSEKIEAAGFEFRYPTLLEALKDLLAREV